MGTPEAEAATANETIALFPTPVCEVALERAGAEALNAGVLRRLASLGLPAGAPAPGARFETDGRLDRCEEVRGLADFARTAADNVATYLQVVHGGLEIRECRALIAGPGAGGLDRRGRNCWLAALYCVDASADESRVSFSDPRPQADVLSPPVLAGAPVVSRVAIAFPPGTLLLFPGWLGCHIDGGGARRIAIELRFSFRDYVKRMSRPKWEGGGVRR